ncbi:MAG: serine O-acetyltransferase [Cellvibrionaceae bacterium]|nr:serine O-acetyltransferase [Cellvibrionaceae bacterium]
MTASENPSADAGRIWQQIRHEAERAVQQHADMAAYYRLNILDRNGFADAIVCLLARHLADNTLSVMAIASVFRDAMAANKKIVGAMLDDLLAHYSRDAACDAYMLPLLNFKGYHALQVYRIAHYYWQQRRPLLANYFQHRVAALWDVDIHPAATLGSGIMLDHATGIVIGETAVIGNDVSILQAVTLGGSGIDKVRRHPKVGAGVLIGAGAKLLGDIIIGECAKIGAGSLVVDTVDAHTTVAGVPARQVGKRQKGVPAAVMDHTIEE